MACNWPRGSVMNHNQCGQLMESWRDEELEMRDEKWEM
jgi:hypothetical protein